MVWIHGGAFSLGQALEYLPNRYMEHDIVLVAIQYRLGPLGENKINLNQNFSSSTFIPLLTSFERFPLVRYG
jgi:carboxylesterase type B